MYNQEDALAENAASLILFLVRKSVETLNEIHENHSLEAELSITGGQESLEDGIKTFLLTIEGRRFEENFQYALIDSVNQIIYDLAIHQRWIIDVDYSFE